MSVHDPIADMLSTVKNATKVGKGEVVVPYSNFKEQLAILLKREGFVAEVRKFKEKGRARFSLAIQLAYDKEGNPKIRHLKRISRSGQRIYSPASGLRPPPLGVKIVSTSQGLLTDGEARKRRLGGELIAEVW